MARLGNSQQAVRGDGVRLNPYKRSKTPKGACAAGVKTGAIAPHGRKG